MEIIDFQATLKAAETDESARKLLGSMCPTFQEMGEYTKLAAPERPFLSELVWAKYSAYSALVTRVVLQFDLIRRGINKPDFLESEEILKMTKAALPHMTEFVDKYGVVGLPYLLQPLKEGLLEEIRRFLLGHEADKLEVQAASELVDLVMKVDAQGKVPSYPPPVTR